MQQEELQKIIDQLESGNTEEEAYWGIFEYGGVPAESYIKANRQGLERFAATLLRASLEVEAIVDDPERSYFALEDNEEWVDQESTTFIDYIEPTLEKREHAPEEPHVETWKGKAMKVGCITAIIYGVFALLLGVYTMAKWVLGF
ncbi:MAG: hypothetical protein AAGB22_04925 [Bacteroidota bacterium]